MGKVENDIQTRTETAQNVGTSLPKAFRVSCLASNPVAVFIRGIIPNS